MWIPKFRRDRDKGVDSPMPMHSQKSKWPISNVVGGAKTPRMAGCALTTSTTGNSCYSS